MPDGSANTSAVGQVSSKWIHFQGKQLHVPLLSHLQLAEARRRYYFSGVMFSSVNLASSYRIQFCSVTVC